MGEVSNCTLVILSFGNTQESLLRSCALHVHYEAKKFTVCRIVDEGLSWESRESWKCNKDSTFEYSVSSMTFCRALSLDTICVKFLLPSWKIRKRKTSTSAGLMESMFWELGWRGTLLDSLLLREKPFESEWWNVPPEGGEAYLRRWINHPSG